MPSGAKRVVFNSLERLLSTDFNRLQYFAARDQQQAWRARHNEQRANWRLFPGVGEQAQTEGIPLFGEVYSGMMVRPDSAAYLTVDPGVAMVIEPTASDDDSAYVFVEDPGVVPGVLTFTANGTAATVRWDVVECQPVEVTLESSNRDQYNPATGLFTPVSMPKVRQTQMTWRIRLGTPGSGFPGAVQGWLPVAVIANRNGATGFDKCDVYDVRPLVEERVRPQPVGTVGNEGYSPILGGNFEVFYTGLVSGYSEAEFGGYLAGGALKNSVIPSSLANFGVSTADMFNGGDAPALAYGNSDMQGPIAGGSQLFYNIAALFPTYANQKPLPRWARYSEIADPVLGYRVPNGPRGILVFTTTAPGPNGLFAPIAFPAAMQLTVNGLGVCLGAIEKGSAGGTHFNRKYRHNIGFSDTVTGVDWKIAASATTATVATWNLTRNVHYPVHAKSLRCSITLQYNTAIATNTLVTVRSADSGGYVLATFYVPAHLVTPGTSPARFDIAEFDIPISPLNDGAANTFPYPPASNTPITWKVTLTFPGSSTFADAYLQIHGWEF